MPDCKSRLVLLAGAAACLGLVAGEATADRIGTTRQAITAGNPVDTDTQQRLGLVTVNGGCSGTLLRQYWILTARHCVTSTATIDGPLLAPQSVTITATRKSFSFC